VAALVGCGGSAANPVGHATTIASTQCPQVATATIGQITRNVYEEAVGGRNERAARKRLARSVKLGSAVAAGDARATRAALRPLIKHQIVRIDITRGTRTLARYGTAKALAPVRGVISSRGRPVGRYVMSVGGRRSVLAEMRTLTGATISTGREVATAGTTTFAARRFPSGALTITTAVSPAMRTAGCAPTREQTVTDTIGAVGQRLLSAEARGAAVRRVLHVVGTDHGFAAAVAARDPHAMRTAIVRLFKDRNLHVVRIAASLPDATKLGDVGGPFALAPASGPVTANGRRVGTVTLSLQDDTGYIKLMHQFTGAAVQLRLAGGLVPGSSPTPIRPYHAFSFAAKSFDGGPLQIALLVPDA
jgi:hypothetical protein